MAREGQAMSEQKNKSTGSKTWVFPDSELPEVTDNKLIDHESLIVLNLNKKKANMKLDLYFTNKSPIKDITLSVEDERVRCFRINKPEDI